MSDNAEAGIAQTQAKAAQNQGAAGLKQHHDGTVTYLNERIVTFILFAAVIGLGVLWATSSSPIVIYGSFAGVIVLVVLWGVFRVRRLQALQRERARQAESWQSTEPE